MCPLCHYQFGRTGGYIRLRRVVPTETDDVLFTNLIITVIIILIIIIGKMAIMKQRKELELGMVYKGEE